MPLPIVLVMLGALGVAAGPLAAQAPERQAIQLKGVRSWRIGGDPLPLPQRDRSGRAREGEPPASVTAAITGNAVALGVRVSRTRPGSTAMESLRLALILWNPGIPPLAPPSVLFVTSGEDTTAVLGGRVFATAASAGPRLLRSAGVWQALGARATVEWDTDGAKVTLNIPLATLNELCPGGLLLDLRLLSGGRLYSLSSAASLGEPPDPNRATAVTLPPISASMASQGRLAALAAAGSPPPAHPGPQLWLWSRTPQPLEVDECMDCEEPSPPVGDMQPEQAMATIENSLKTLESDLLSGPAIVPALRALGRALFEARIQLADSAGPGGDLRARILTAIRDQNSRAAYGADLLLLHDMVPEARALLEEVIANDAAQAPARSHALLRLEQLSAASLDWHTALDFAERLPLEAPFDIDLRATSLGILTLAGANGESRPDLETRAQALCAALAADRRAICRRYFDADAAASGSGSCPLAPTEVR